MWSLSSKGTESKVQPDAHIRANVERKAMLKIQTMITTESPRMEIMGPGAPSELPLFLS